jgi:thiol-disulfide isomerase/thioredoxin
MKYFSKNPPLKNEHTSVQRVILGLAILLLSVTLGMAQDVDSVRRGPRILKGSQYGVGRLIPTIEMTDVTGRAVSLRPSSESQLLVVCLTGTGCPLAKRYTPTLAQLEEKYHPRGIDFVFINPNKSESTERVRAAIATHRLQGSYVRDTEREFVGRLAARTTTEVFVIDTAGTLRYRGAVDDQYGIGYSLSEPRVRYLADAVDALLEDQRPPVEATWAPGCELGLSPSVDTVESVTYHNRISRILQHNCIACHRDSGAAPFSLESADAVHDYAGMVADVVRRGTMPPWFAAPQEAESDTLKWANDCSLCAADKVDLLAWLGSGRPLGDPADAPLSIEYPVGWTIGEPDVILQLPEPVAVAATGQMPYQNLVVRTHFEEGKWVKPIFRTPKNSQRGGCAFWPTCQTLRPCKT